MHARTIMSAAAVVLAAGVMLSLGGCRKKASADLVIVSPHSKEIESEFEQAFRAWHKEKYGSDVAVEWRDVGGTSQITQYLVNQYDRAVTSDIDVYFGGGAPDHENLAGRGCLVAVTLPEEILAGIPQTIGGIEQYDPQHRWHAAVISSFGILYNTKFLQEKNLPLPRTWDDLAAPAMFGWVEAADAAKSGSARAAYEMVIQSEKDWPAGWAKLLRIFGNCKRFVAGASDVTGHVASGDVLAGAAIDFYAYNQIASSGGKLGFVLPEGMTAFTPDPISLLKGAPHAAMAQRFIEFVLSDRGQALWCLPAGVPGGPAKYSLYRQPVRKDVYAKYKGKMLPMLVNPFEVVGGFKYDQAAAKIRVGSLLGPLMTAAAMQNSQTLPPAWKAVIDGGLKPESLKEFTALPPDLADWPTAAKTAEGFAKSETRERATNDWREFFLAKYKKLNP